jgi:hypothetical protein
MTESTTISGNERRRAVKKIAVGAAVVGAIAAGAGKLIDISSQSKGSNSPAAQTILTSQGLIPPALTSDPSNPVPGQMWYRSDAGVMAHFDAVQNRVVYSSEINDGNAHVTTKGIVNGLSVLPNDGTGWFGPDTTKGATAPGQYGSPYTQTVGVQEVTSYVIAQGGGTIMFKRGKYDLTNAPNQNVGNSTTAYTLISLPNISSSDSTVNISFIGEDSPGVWEETSPISQESMVTLYAGQSTGNNVGIFGWQDQYNETSNPGGITNIHVFIDKIHLQVASWSSMIPLSLTGIASWEIGTIMLSNDSLTTSPTSPTINPDTFGAVLGNSANSASCYARLIKLFGFAFGLGLSATHILIEKLEIDYTDQALTVSPGGYGAVINDLDIQDSTTALQIGNQTELKIQFLSLGTGMTGTSVNLVKPNNTISDPTNVVIDSIQGYYSSLPSYTYTSNLNVIINNFLTPSQRYTPTISANPPVSGTAYQNTNPYDIEIDLPVYATTAGTAGYVTLAKGATSTPTAIGNQFVNGSTSSTSVDIIRLIVPAGWYYEFTASGVTFGTASVFAD